MQKLRPVRRSLKLKYNRATTASKLIERLPIHAHRVNSEHQLTQLKSRWQQWCEAPERAKYQLFRYAKLDAFVGGALSISTEHAAVATLIKHQSHSLRRALEQSTSQNNQVSAPPITDIRISLRVAGSKPAELERGHLKVSASHVTVATSPASIETTSDSSSDKAVGPEAVTAVETAAQNSRDELRASLERLAKTLLATRAAVSRPTS